MFDVTFIQWLQSFASPVLDTFFALITHAGSHFAYILILPFVYWAVDREVGRRLAGLVLGSMWLNGLMKEYLIMPRPDPELVRVIDPEPSPGFPSGHAQGVISVWAYLAYAVKRRWLTWLAVILIILVPVSRLYLGVHFPIDVIGGLVIGGLLVLGFIWLTERPRRRTMATSWRVFLTVAVPLLLYPLYQTSAAEQIIGIFIGFFTAEILVAPYFPFQEKVSLSRQLAKLAIGYAGFFILIALHVTLLPVGLPSVFGYSLIALWLTMGAPALFRLFGLAGEVEVPGHTPKSRLALKRYFTAAAAVFVFVLGSAVYVKEAVVPATAPAFMPSDRIWNIGHRGAKGLAPENTLAAIAAALENGADIVEIDLWLTRDGEPVIIHDATVDRTTNGQGRVGDMTLAELKSLDAGYRFTPDNGQTYPWRDQGVTVPTLREVLTGSPGVPLLIEIKDPNPETVDRVLAVIDEADARDRVMLASFHDHILHRVRDTAPDIPTSYGKGEATRLVIMQRLGLGPYIKPVASALQLPEWQGPLRVVSRGLIRFAERQGLQTHVWTINDEEAMYRLIGVGVNGIITDYPDRARKVIESMESHSLQQSYY